MFIVIHNKLLVVNFYVYCCEFLNSCGHFSCVHTSTQADLEF